MSYIEHLSKDKKLKRIVNLHGQQILERADNICVRLCASIISQQLSTKVAAVIFSRFLGLFKGQEPTPKQILRLDHEKLRSIGLSNSKATYVQNVARFAIERGMELKRINEMDEKDLIAYLTEIKGVGQWTVEMLMMFTLGREDVFCSGDLGIQNAMEQLYELDKTNKKKFIENLISISNSWRPFRTYACIHLWRWSDEKKSKKILLKNQSGK